jgi:NADH-quinone oxidoreductase subunit C/D
MFKWKEFDKTKEILSHSAENLYRNELGQHHLYLRPNDLLDWIEFLKDDLDFFTLVDLAASNVNQDRFEVIYQLLNMGTHQRLNIHIDLNRGEILPSLQHFYLNADWMEREQGEIFGLTFDSKKESLILPDSLSEVLYEADFSFDKFYHDGSSSVPKLRFNPNKSEAPYPEESYKWQKYDLFSSQTQGHFESFICFDPVKIVDLKIKIGFYHQGFEKLLQSKDIFQVLHLVDKINFSSAPSFSIAWAKTIEELFRIKIPERAQAIRIVLLELSRIAHHLTVMASICKVLELPECSLFINLREKIFELFEKYSGHRHSVNVVKMGGMREDLPHGWIVEYQTVSEMILKNLKIIHNSLIGQRKFRSSLEGDSVNAQSILQWGVSGPAMRAAGLNFDLRKSQPFYFYHEIDFDIPVGINGTAYDRYLIRYEEICQSLRITTQVIDNLPLGEIIPQSFDKNYFELIKVFGQLEQNGVWHYNSIESPSGEAGYMVKINKGINLERIKIKTPSYSLAQALPVLLKGLKENQLGANIASLGLSRWEMDR